MNDGPRRDVYWYRVGIGPRRETLILKGACPKLALPLTNTGITTIAMTIIATCMVLVIDASAQNITVNHDLTFGNIVSGVPKDVDKADAGAAAEFYVSGTAGSEISIEFSLPTYMSGSGNTMQLIFREMDCSMDSSASPDQSSPGLDNQDPWHPITYRLGSNGLTIWLGGTAIPGLSQRSGSYNGLIVLTVSYTGN